MAAARLVAALFLVLGVTSPLLAAAPPADTLVERMMDAAGGRQRFKDIGVLKLVLDEEETLSDGKKAAGRSTAYVATPDLDNLRMEMPGGIVIVKSGGSGWATVRGEIDTRPQAPFMAQGVLRQRLFPILLPFSLNMDGVQLGNVTETQWEGSPAWRLVVRFAERFFASPIMQTPWELVVSQRDSTLLAVEFQPPPELSRQIGTEGMRFRALTHKPVASIRLPAHVLIDGIDRHGVENGHVRVVKIVASQHGPWDATLFLSPAQLEAFED